MDTFKADSRRRNPALGHQSGYNAGEQAAAEQVQQQSQQDARESAARRKACESTRAAEQSSESRKRCGRKETDTAQGRKGLTSRTERATLRSIEHTKARYSTEHESRVHAKNPAMRSDKPPARACEVRGTRRAQPREGAQDARESRAVRARARSREGTHTGGSGQRAGSEGVSHERTKFRCT